MRIGESLDPNGPESLAGTAAGAALINGAEGGT